MKVLYIFIITVLLSLPALGQTSSEENIDSTIQKIRVDLNGQQVIEVVNNHHFQYLISLGGDTIIPFEDYYFEVDFTDINGDGYKDIRVYVNSNTPNQCNNYLFDPATKKYKLIQDCDLDIRLLKGTNLFFTYNHAGCSDNNWESHLCKIENWKEVDIGHIDCHNCGDKNDGIKIYKVTNINKTTCEKLIKEMPVPKFDISSRHSNKWVFMKKYWLANYKLFE